MPEMHLRQPGFTKRVYGPLTKKQKKNKKFKETVVSWYMYRNEQDKACFQYSMEYGDFKDLPRRTASDKVLHDNAFEIATNPKYDGNQSSLELMVYKRFDEKDRDIHTWEY